MSDKRAPLTFDGNTGKVLKECVDKSRVEMIVSWPRRCGKTAFFDEQLRRYREAMANNKGGVL